MKESFALVEPVHGLELNLLDTRSCLMSLFDEIVDLAKSAGEIVDPVFSDDYILGNRTMIMKVGNFSFVKSVTNNSIKQKELFKIGDLNILEIAVESGNVTTFKIDMALLGDMREFAVKLKKKVENEQRKK